VVLNARLRLSLLAALVCFVVVALAAVASAERSKSKALLLPDLVQEAPRDVSVRVVDGEARLGFGSAVSNAGAGPLMVRGERTARQKEMIVAQRIEREDGTVATRNAVGRFRYTSLPDHSHWHYLRFDRYFVRPAGGTTVAADHKSGFCLGDRFNAALKVLPGEPSQPPYSSRCGLRRPDLLKVNEGISVGYGDNYDAYLEGQHVVIQGFPAGAYELVHETNADRRLLEERYDNNTSCVGFDLSYDEDGGPEIDGPKPCTKP
jgi:hypothetical protein